MQYRSCYYLENFGLFIMGTDHKVTLCCAQSPMPNGVPKLEEGDTPAEFIENLYELRANILSESVKLALSPSHRVHTTKCADCIIYNEGNWSVGSNGLINVVALGVYPSPCQCKCIYCNSRDRLYKIDEDAKELYNKSFRLLSYAVDNNLISPHAEWSIACGEITIHPFKEKIYALTKGRNTIFDTNGFVFDKHIGEQLKLNILSRINISLDCGTSETWHKIKGVNNFPQVMENINKYCMYAQMTAQITFKYIILPDVNDNSTDISGFVTIISTLKANVVTISREMHSEKRPERLALIKNREEYLNKELNAAGMLFAMLRKHEITPSFWGYTQEEIDKIIKH